MSNHWLLAIGVNQYRHLLPLNYAQADAQALWNFLVGKSGFMPDRCLLLTDTSPFIEGRSTYPSKENIHKWIEWLLLYGTGQGSPLKSGDVLWCFFSGYAVNWEGEDYLMPIDGNPGHISDTGISVRSLLERIKSHSGVMPVVLLDMKHPPVTGAGVGVGTQTLQLAGELEIPALLSCQPHQNSSESSDLSHGLFAKALLDGLRSGAGTTLGDLTQVLSESLPALSESHSLPRQDLAIAVYPKEKMHRVLLPHQAIASPNGSQPVSETLQSDQSAPVGATLSPALAAVQQHTQNLSTLPGTAKNPFEAALSQTEPDFADSAEAARAAAAPQPTNELVPPRNSDTEENGSLWQRVSLWTGGALLILLALVSIFGRTFTPRQGTVGTSPNGTVPTLSPPGSPEQVSQARLKQATGQLQGNQVSQFNKAIAIANQIKPGEPLHQEAQESVNRWSQVILDTAQGRAAQGNFEAAIAAAGLIPKEQSSYEEAQTLISRWRGSAKQQQTNRNLLQAAKKQINPEQASSYNKAIDLVRQIPPGQPGSAEAKKLTAQWSQTILSLAQARASQGFTNAAIQTASLVPNNTPAYPKAKAAIDQWKRQLTTPKK